MTDAQKLTMLKQLLQISDTSQDTLLSTYLTIAKEEILSWLYSATGSIPSTVTNVPAMWEPVQVWACVIGYSQDGAQGEVTHNENGINRRWQFSNMFSYIHANVLPYAGVG